MPKVNSEVLKSVENALEKYEAEVSNAPLMQTTKDTYTQHARNFVRWLKDDFEPGATLKNQ